MNPAANERMHDSKRYIDISVEAYNDLLDKIKDSPALSPRLQIAGFG